MKAALNLLFCVLIFGATCAHVEAANSLANDRLQIGFNPQTGVLAEFFSSETKHQFIISQTNCYLWELRFHDSSGGIQSLNSSQAKSFAMQKMKAHSVRLTWKNFNLPFAPDFQVEATVQLDQDAPLSRWKISLLNSQNLRFDEVRFPCVQNIAAQENEFLAVPVWMGQIAAGPRSMLNKDGQSHEWRYEYPGLTSMQCLAFYQNNGPGFYFSCDDTNAFHKTFIFSGDGQGAVNFSLSQLPENKSDSSGGYVQQYNAVLGTFSGDWFTAAEIYRSWATNQWWAREARLAKNESNWSRDTALWVWNRGRSEGVIQPALALQKQLGLPVSVMWHWWHGCPYDTGFPEYFPPREGIESFTNALRKAHEQNVHAIVYMNQRLWGMTTKSWEEKGVTNFAVVAADGKIHPEVYNTFTKLPCASMCMGTPFWRNHYASLTKDAFLLGVDGIYMDQACSSLACYNPAHGHPPGGGTYWMNGFRLMANDIRARAKNVSARETAVLAGEGVGESWLPYLDLMLSLQVSRERYSNPDGWETIPFFQAVYHPFAIQYGNYSSLAMPPYDDLWPKEFAPKEPLKLLDRKFSQQFYLEQARAFVWGQQPTIANFQESHLTDRPEEIAYALRLAKIRNSALPFLLHGIFLRPPKLTVPGKTIDISRLSIYAGQQGGLTTFRKEVPLAVAGAWRAPDKTMGIALASISNEQIAVALDLSDPAYISSRPAEVFQTDQTGRKRITRLAKNEKKIVVKLPPRGACFLEILPR